MVRIFVYGTLKRGCCRSHVLRDQQFLRETRTVAAYRMYNTGSYPALVEDKDGLSVEGEVWEVDEECLRVLDAIEGVPTLYERKPVALQESCAEGIQTYVYRQPVEGMVDCGIRWEDEAVGFQEGHPLKPVYLADIGSTDFENQKNDVDVVCAGDSITGWNNFGPANCWPYPTYPQFLQLLCAPQRFCVADGGIAGEVSGNGLGHVRRYLDLFPNSRCFIVGFGTNDLGTWSDLESTSHRIIENLDAMIRAVRDREKLPILFNVPYGKESVFPPDIARETHEKRDYHNGRLMEYCDGHAVPLADICSCLRDEHFGDELHPNQAGAQVLAEEVFRTLSPVLEASNR